MVFGQLSRKTLSPPAMQGVSLWTVPASYSSRQRFKLYKALRQGHDRNASSLYTFSAAL
jgi:hypothetical protein